MRNCKDCDSEIKFQCRCGSMFCDEGFLRSFCNEECRDKYEDGLIPKAITVLDSLTKEQREVLTDVFGESDAVSYFLWSKYF